MRLLMFNLATDLDDSVLGFTTQWIREISRQVKHIDVITVRAGRVEVPDNVTVRSVGTERKYSRPRRLIEFYRIMVRYITSSKIDACFSHMTPQLTVAAYPVLKLLGIPIVTWYAHRQVTPILIAASRFSDRVVSANRESFPLSSNNLIPIGHGINTELFQTSDGNRVAGQHLILSVGRLSPIKDLDTLIDALAILKAQDRHFKCLIVGNTADRDKAYTSSLATKAKRIGLKDDIEFVGPLPQTALPEFYDRAFAHVNCSPADHSIDKAPLEAMAMAKPSLSSTHALRETMGNWADHLLFQQSDPSDLAKKLKDLMELPQAKRNEMQADLRKAVSQMHSLNDLATRLVQLLEQLSDHKSDGS